jgi:hypothetical protein
MKLTQGIHQTTTGLERPGQITFGLLAPKVQHGWLGPNAQGKDQLLSPVREVDDTHSKTPFKVMMAWINKG